MTDRARHAVRLPRLPRSCRVALGTMLASVMLAGCASAPRYAVDPVDAYYRYDFVTAREALRPAVDEKPGDDLLLDLMRLGAASMADGDVVETEETFRAAFDLLSTAGLNQDRTVGAVMLHEGVRIWKGEPFEQALAYTWIATHYGTRGDWENMRAAAANSLFRLTDFGAEFVRDIDSERLLRRSTKEPDLLIDGYTARDSGFVLGQLLTAIGAELSGAGGDSPLFDTVVAARPDLGELVEMLRRREYDTLLIVDYGRGPAKVAFGPDFALVRHEARERRRGPLAVDADGQRIADAMPICDVNAMAQDLRWNALENVRRAKSVLGDVLMFGGLVTVGIGADQSSSAAMAAGAGAALLGLLMKAGARADERHLEFLPAAIYLVPLELGRMVDLQLTVAPPSASRVTLPQFVPGARGRPRLAYVRLHGAATPPPAWLVADDLLYGNDHTTVAEGDWPWILGGHDVGTPSPTRLAAFRAAGTMEGWTVSDLEQAHAAAGVIIGAGMAPRSDPPRRSRSFRHVLEGGDGLFTPQPDSMGYKRIMYTPTAVPTVPPTSDGARNRPSN